ncbi:MAG: YdjY domain-containing protein [Rubritalea sp.]|uniref:YdjY domain-containing protein n=1 Tax=Rubritalea sp. TaxID=2109375 RepID=UPI0032421C5A
MRKEIESSHFSLALSASYFMILTAMKNAFAISLALLTTSSALFANEANDTAPKKPEVKKIGERTYQLGKITFDSSKGEISFPATLEHNEVLIEYLLTAPEGKIHETLFITEISPFNLNVAMKLLGYKESKELLKILDENHTPTDKYHSATEIQKKKSRFTITASWKVDGKKVSHDVTQLLENAKTQQPMPDSPWIYSGSYMINGNYKPDISGDIIAVFTDRSSIACYSGEGRYDDTLWMPKQSVLPPLGTAVTLTFTQTNPNNQKK